MIKVSVIMPVFNAEKYLRECLDSLCSQTMKDFEVICVDDGSTDGSAAILSEYCAKDPRMKVIRQENTGAGAARNRGFSQAKGEYVIFLDCDDFFADGLLEKTWQAGVDKKADIVLFCARKYDNLTGTWGPEHDYLSMNNLPQKEVFSGQDVPNKIFVMTSPAPWLRLLRADFIREKELRFQNLRNSNDYFFTQLAMAEAERICYIKEDLVFYRINNAASLQGKRAKHNLCFAQAIEALYDELNARNLYTPYRISFIHTALGCFNDKIRHTNDTEARNEIFRYMESDSFQRMRLLGGTVKDYGGEWLYNLANDQHELLAWYAQHNRQAEKKKTELIIPRKSREQPLVSVVIPMYNVEEYVQETLRSISEQTLKNMEIICINDGSSDGTLAIAEAYAQKEPRMSVYSHSNSGPSETRNAGLAAVQGKYVYFIDGDDMLDRHALSELSELMERQALDVALFDADVLAEDEQSGKAFVYKRSVHYDGVSTGPELFTNLKGNKEYYCCPVMYLLRTDFVRENHLQFQQAIIHEDQPFTFQVMLLAKRVSHIQKAFYLRRVRPESIMTKKTSFANVHGLFFSYLAMSAALTNHTAQLTAAQHMAFAEQVSAVLSSIQNGYSSLTSAQQYCRFTLGEYEPIFRNLIVRSFDNQEQLRRELSASTIEKNKLQKQLKDYDKEAASKSGLSFNGKIKKRLPIQSSSDVQLHSAQNAKVKRMLKRIIPVSYNRSSFEAQVLADLVCRRTYEMENNHEARFAMLTQYEKMFAQQQNARLDTMAALQEKLLQQQVYALETMAAQQEKPILPQSKILADQREAIQRLDEKMTALVEKERMLSCYTAMATLRMAEEQQLPSNASGYMIFSDFSITEKGFSCLIKSSKRSAADRIEFNLSMKVGVLHADMIACALSTLCGQSYSNIYFDLPISREAKDSLQAFTKATWHIPDYTTAYKPDAGSNKIMLSFSGGFDSLAAKALLPDNTELVAVDFGGWFERETDFFQTFHPHVLSTNFRKLKYDREHWTFMGTGALLFASALNASHIVFGTIFEANTDQISDQSKTAQSMETPPFSTLGLKDIHLTNGLTEVATAMIVTYYYPNLVQKSLKSLAAVGSEKLYRKQVLTDIVCKRFYRALGPIELTLPNTAKWGVPFGTTFALDFLALYELKYAGLEVVSRTVQNIPDEAVALAQRLKLRFYERLNPKFLNSVPAELQHDYLDKLRAAGVTCYDDDDWAEMREVRAFLAKYHREIQE